MPGFARDLRHALRGLLRTPGYTVVCLVTLALGIGATTAIFSVLKGVVLRPLPYPEPERLVFLEETFRGEGVERRPLSALDFIDWRARSRSLERMAAVAGVTVTLPGETPERVPAEIVSAGYLETYGVQPLLGRGFALEEELPGGRAVALLSHALWQRRFAGDAAVLGQTVEISGTRLEVVGVLPEGFAGASEQAQVWLPFGQAALVGRADALEERGDRWLSAVGRLAPGASVESAQRELEAIAADLERAYPQTNADRGARVLAMRATILGPLGRALAVLMGAVAFVLLLTCANLANLTLARSSDRRRELAIRASLGAQRGRLARQLIGESLVLGLAGGALGIVLAWWGKDALLAVSPVQLPGHARVALDPGVFLFATAVSLLTPLIFGAGPALVAARPDLNAVLKEGGRGGTDTVARRRVAHGLVVAQVALALLLTVGAGLTLRSLLNVLRTDAGFRSRDVIAMEVDLPEATTPEAAAAFARTLLERIRAVPGVRAAAVASDTPLGGDVSARRGTVEVGGAPREFRFYVHRVTPGFFDALGARLVRGRDFAESDASGDPVVVVAEKLAERFWPGEDPVGQRIRLGGPDSDGPWATVVGVAGEVRHRTLVDDPAAFPDDPDVYIPLLARSDPNLAVVVRTADDPAGIVAAARRELRAIDPTVPLSSVETLESRIERQMAGRRFVAWLLAGFAGLALVLAAVGIHGLLATWVARRTREVGVRMALGARAVDLLRSIVGQGVALAGLGVALGTLGALALTRVLGSLLVGVSARDPLTFVGVALLLVTVAGAASLFPARRATSLDPASVLRTDL